VEAEATASKLRAELATAMDRAQTIQEQLQNQTKLASSKDHIIQSITEESEVLQTNLKGAVDKIVHLSLELRLERIRRLHDRDKQLDQQVRMRDCHEAEIRRIAQEAWSAQEKLATLHNLQSRIRTGQYSPVYGILPPRAPSPMLETVYTGECSTPRVILHTNTPPVSPAIDSDSSCSTKTAQDPSLHDWGDSSTLQADHLLQISACFNQVSHVTESHVAALEGLLGRICQLESERAQPVTPTEPDDNSLERELAETAEKLRITEEKVLTLRRNFNQSRKAMCDMESQTRDVGHELDKCQARLRESEDERRAMEIQFAERLRLLSAELESSKAQVEASRLECSQATSLSTTLQERIDELEVQITTLKNTRNYPSTTNIDANSSLRAPEESSRRPHTHCEADLSTPSSAFHLPFSTCYNSTSNIAKDPRPSLEESSESALDRTPTEPDDRNLGKSLTATIDQLRLVKEEIVTLRRDFDQSKDPVQEAASQDLADPSTCQIVLSCQISSCVDQVSGITKDHRAVLRELIHRACELESKSAQDVTSTKPDSSRLEEELAATTEQLRHAEEEVGTLRCNLDQSRVLMREVESQAQDLAHKLENCQAELQESQVRRRAGNLRFVKVVERLRLRSAALESSRAEVDALQLRYSQATSLSAVRLDRIDELEAQLTTLKSTSYPSTITTINADSPLRAPQGSRKSPSQHLIDQRAKLQEMIECMRRPEPASAQDASPGHDDRRLEEKLATTMGLLRLAEKEILTLRHGLDQSRKTMWDVEFHADGIVNSFRTKLIKSEDARQALENKFVEAVENLRLRSAELEASMVEAEASQFKCSQITFLAAALQERVDELEGEVKLLKGTRDYLAPTVAPSPSLFVTDTGIVSPPSTQSCALILDFEAISPNANFIDSTDITVPSSLTRLLDLSLPQSSSLSNDDSLYFGQHGCLAILPAFIDSSRQDHIHGPEAEVMTLGSTQDYSTTTPSHTSSHSSLPRALTDTGMVSPPSTQSCTLI